MSTRKKTKIILNERNQKVFEMLPLASREVVFNLLLSETINNGMLISLLRLFIPDNQVRDIIDKINDKIIDSTFDEELLDLKKVALKQDKKIINKEKDKKNKEKDKNGYRENLNPSFSAAKKDTTEEPIDDKDITKRKPSITDSVDEFDGEKRNTEETLI